MKLLDIPSNHGALKRWAQKFGNYDLVDIDSIRFLEKNEILILPGGNIGTFVDNKISDAILASLKNGVRLLAICGGFQSLFKYSNESQSLHSLGLYDGIAVRLEKPKIGLFDIQCDFFSGKVYFNCQYNVKIAEEMIGEKGVILDEMQYCQGIFTRNILGVQFHPDLSNGVFDSVVQIWLQEK